MKGIMLVFDGGEGAGKTSVMTAVEKSLTDKGCSVLVTREPGGTVMAEEIRELLKRQRDECVAPETELLLMYAARNQHMQNVILPALDDGRIILCDRFVASSVAYQSFARGMPLSDINMLNTLVLGDFRVDMTFILDLPVTQGLERARQRGETDRFEQEDIAFFERARKGFLAQAAANPSRFCVIDASRNAEQVKNDVVSKVLGYVSRKEFAVRNNSAPALSV